MRINEAAQETGLSADTIRYYEKQGLLPPVTRDPSGHRQFSPDNINWMTILYWLRKTGMSMEVMSQFARLVHAGSHTIPERLSILRAHETLLTQRREDLDRCADLLAHKIGVYSKFEEGAPDDND
jgi:DNA-binding transcriptional MerR regulator